MAVYNCGCSGSHMFASALWLHQFYRSRRSRCVLKPTADCCVGFWIALFAATWIISCGLHVLFSWAYVSHCILADDVDCVHTAKLVLLFSLSNSNLT